MNERIRELAEQAVMAVDNPFPGNPLNDELEKMYIPDCFADKFAELIVKECSNMAEAFHRHQYDFTGDLELHEFMKKHFGVEE